MDRHIVRKCNWLTNYAFSVLVLSALTPINIIAAPPDFSWVHRMGGSGVGLQVVHAAVDAADNTFVIGSFGNTRGVGAAFGNMILTGPTNGLDSFIAKLDRHGTWLWVRKITQATTNTHNIRAEAAATSSNGSVIITGENLLSTNVIAVFGTNTVSLSSGEIFVAKYSGDGDCLWARGVGGFDPTYGHCVATDSADNIYVSGVYGRTNDFLLLKLDPDGNELLRLKPEQGSNLIVAHAVRTDADGNMYICGLSTPPVWIQGVGLTNATVKEAFAMKFDQMGKLLWVREGGGNNTTFNNSWAYDLALDSKTNVVISGSVWATNLFGVSLPLPSGSGQPYFLKLNSVGSNLWLQVISDTRANSRDFPVVSGGAWRVGLDATDNSYVIGTFYGTADFGSRSLTAGGTITYSSPRMTPRATVVGRFGTAALMVPTTKMTHPRRLLVVVASISLEVCLQQRLSARSALRTVLAGNHSWAQLSFRPRHSESNKPARM